MSTPAAASSEKTAVSPKTEASIWPFLISLAAVAGFAELAYAIVGVSALPLFITNALKLPVMPGVALTAFYLSEAVFATPMGSLADKIGRRRLMVAGAGLAVLTTITTSFLRAPRNDSWIATAVVVVAIVCLRLVDGLGAAMFWPAIFASVADRIPQHRQATAMSALNITYLMGLALGPKVGGYLNDSMAVSQSLNHPSRYYPSFFSAALFFALAGGMAYLVAPRRNSYTPIAGQEDAANPHDAPFSLDAVKDALRRVPILMAVAFVTFFAIGLIAPSVKLFAMERFHISENSFGTLLLYAALPIAAVSIPLGHLGDRWGKVRAIHLGMAICSISLWMILRIHHQYAVVIVGALLGIGFVMSFPAYMALLADLSGPNERGGVIGAVRMAQGFGAMVGASTGSFFYTRFGHETPFLISASFLTFAFFAGLFFIHEAPASPEDKNTA